MGTLQGCTAVEGYLVSHSLEETLRFAAALYEVQAEQTVTAESTVDSDRPTIRG